MQHEVLCFSSEPYTPPVTWRLVLQVEGHNPAMTMTGVVAESILSSGAPIQASAMAGW